MDEILFPGSKVGAICGICIFLFMAGIGFAAYKEKRLSEIAFVKNQMEAYEASLEKSNQMEIEGIREGFLN